MYVSIQQEFVRQHIQIQRLGQAVIPVNPESIVLHKSAELILQGAVRQVAAETHMPEQYLAERLFDYVYRLEPLQRILLLLWFPERGVEMIVELPYGAWKNSDKESGYAFAM